VTLASRATGGGVGEWAEPAPHTPIIAAMIPAVTRVGDFMYVNDLGLPIVPGFCMFHLKTAN